MENPFGINIMSQSNNINFETCECCGEEFEAEFCVCDDDYDEVNGKCPCYRFCSPECVREGIRYE